MGSRFRPYVRWLAPITLLAACNLVGYDELRDPAQGLDAAGIPDPGQTASVTDSSAAPNEAGAALDAAPPGQGDASAQDARVDGMVDATTSASMLADGWWDGLAPKGPKCGDGVTCYPECANKWDKCELQCDDASACQPKCLTETACHVDCGNTPDCEMACKVDSECWLDCKDADFCLAYCTTGARCTVDCTGAGTCDIQCLAGASCDVDCTGDVDCSGYVCSPGAECLMHCGDDGCNFDCQGQGQSCPDHHEVCNRDCP